jgi:putative phage-type endonuclease
MEMAEAAEATPTGPTLDRASYLGASEIAAVAGISPYASALDVWATKRGLAEREETDRMRAGTELERPILERLYAPPRGLVLMYPGTVRHPAEPWMAATPDAIACSDDDSRDVQCKLVGHRQVHRWGDPDEGRDGIPPEVLCQVTWEMGCAGLRRADVPALFGTELRVYAVELDEDFLRDLIALGRAFWEGHVVTGDMPEVTAGSRPILERYFGRERTGLMEAPTGGETLARQYLAAAEVAKGAAAEKDRLGNELRALIGEAEGFSGPFGKVTWKTQKGRTNYKAAAEAFAPNGAAWKETYRGEPSRVLRVNVKESQ